MLEVEQAATAGIASVVLRVQVGHKLASKGDER
jgi:hypothetical protein